MKALRKYPFEPDYAVPPGATLEETMQDLGMTQRELADRTGLTVQTLNRIFKGSQPITCETANKLELVTNTPAAFWNNLETNYREQLSKLEQARELKSQLDWLKTIPVKELTERGAIPSDGDKVVVLREVFRFYAVSSVLAWKSQWENLAIAARRCPLFASSPGPTSAWLRLGQLKARQMTCAPYDRKRFQENLTIIRGLTTRPAEEFVPEMKRLCAEAGVALVLEPEIKGAPWSGATEWLTPVKAMILLNLRGKTEDRFWFTFFHEAAHILYDSKKETFIDDGKPYREKPEEKRADDFAAESLISRVHDGAIRAARSDSQINILAKKLKISPGIVVGRYHHLTKNWSHFNKLMQRFEWAKAAE